MTALAREYTELTATLPQQLPSAPLLHVVPSTRPVRNALRLFAVLALAAGLTSAAMVGFATLVSGWSQI